jgi:hypothetical protein
LRLIFTILRTLVLRLLQYNGNWHRIGFVRDGSHRKRYVDGNVVAEDEQNELAGSINGLYIGCGKSREAGSLFSGLIDDVRIYKRAVSP